MATLNLDSAENVYLYKGGEVRISNSAQEAEQLRRQGWSDTAPDEVSDEAMAKAEADFEASNKPELEGENITPENPSGAAVPPADQAVATRRQSTPKADVRKASGRGAVMTTRDTGGPVYAQKASDEDKK